MTHLLLSAQTATAPSRKWKSTAGRDLNCCGPLSRTEFRDVLPTFATASKTKQIFPVLVGFSTLNGRYQILSDLVDVVLHDRVVIPSHLPFNDDQSLECHVITVWQAHVIIFPPQSSLVSLAYSPSRLV